MAGLDERKIEEIVAKVLERLGGGSNGATAKAQALTTSHIPQSERRTANVPRGTNGVYADPDQAAKAARKAFEQNERTAVDLLDFDVRYDQGFLFSPPRPLRPEGPATTAPASPVASSAVAGRPRPDPAATPRTGLAALVRRAGSS